LSEIAVPMPSYKERLDMILDAAGDIASKEFQEEAWPAWPAGGPRVSTPDEIYEVLMDDSWPDLFFEEYGKTFSSGQMQCWNEFRSRLDQYFDKLPPHSDFRVILDDPEWDLVRQAAQRFVTAFSEPAGGATK
jgi:hypothetical protein